MLEYNKSDVSEDIDVKKTGASSHSVICRLWYFLEINFRFQPQLQYDCHDLIQEDIIINGVAIITVKANGFRIHLWYE